MSRKPTRVVLEQSAAAIRAEDEARLGKIYGKLLTDVLLLRSRGFVVTKERGQLMIGGRPIVAEDLQAKASRERRLMGVPQPTAARRVVQTAGGLKVGDTVAAPSRAVSAASQRRLSTVKQKAIVPKVADHSTDLGAKPRVVWLDLGLLKVDGSYQRDVGEGGRAHINRIVKAFNWNCYQPIVVTERDGGTFAVIDGQHRLEAAKKHPLIDSLPCYIIDAPNVALQASIFVSINTARLSLTSFHKFWAAHAAGHKAAVSLVEICKRAGVTVPRSQPQAAAAVLAIMAPLVAQRLIERHGPAPVREAINLLAVAHPATRLAFRSHFVEALVRIAVDPAYRPDRAAKVLAATDLVELQAATIMRAGGNGGGRAGVTEQILREKFGMVGRLKAAA